jgi:hypothetical protein
MKRFALVGLLAILGNFQEVAKATADTVKSPMTLTVEAREGPSEPQVRVTITNTTKAILTITMVKATDLLDILVQDSSGKLVEQRKPPSRGYRLIVPDRKLKPGESFVAGSNWSDGNDGWVSLTEWGYPGLKGSFTITARPGFYLNGSGDAKPYTEEEAKIRPAAVSNAITINI